MNEQIRKEFERDFTVPDDAVYIEAIDQYSWAGYPSSPHPINQSYEAWQAAHARYAGSGEAKQQAGQSLCPYIASSDHGTSYCRLAAQPKVPDRAALIELLTATSKQSEGVTADLIIAMLSAQDKQ